mgnify:CR=1 FL=1
MNSSSTKEGKPTQEGIFNESSDVSAAGGLGGIYSKSGDHDGN